MQGYFFRRYHLTLNPIAGGVKGAYEIGALKALVDNLEAQEVAYDVVSGVSVGSINSAGLSLYKKGDEKSGLDFLCMS